MSDGTRRVLVTGAATGIGRATADELLLQGARVAGLDVNGDELARLESASAGSFRAWIADVSDADVARRAVGEAAAWLGGLDAVVHAAGIMLGQGQQLEEVELDTWARVLAVNLTGTFIVAQAARPFLAQQSRSALVLVASGGGVSGPSGSVPYGASKGGMHGLALTLAPKLAAQGIRVIDVCPGSVDTPLIRASIAEGLARGGDESAYRATEASLVDAAEVGRVIAWLTTPAAHHVTRTVFTS